MLEDIAILTGGKAITEDLGIKLENVKLERPRARPRRSRSTRTTRRSSRAPGRRSEIEGRVEQIRTQIDETTSDYDREKLQERLAKLVGGVAVINVGAATETEMKEKKARVEDAMHATQAAVEEGIVPGGGVALLRAIPALDKLLAEQKDLSHDVRVGIELTRRALEEPARWIATNAGLEGSVVVAQIKASKEPDWGYNAQEARFENLTEAGVIDPTKVVRIALQNASSIAALMLTTEAVVAEIPEKRKAAPAPPGDGRLLMRGPDGARSCRAPSGSIWPGVPARGHPESSWLRRHSLRRDNF